MTTIWLTVASMVLGVVGGVVVAVMRLSDNLLLRTISGAFVWLFRGTPVLVQILIWFNLALFFPRLGFGSLSVSTNDLVTPFTAALLALTLNEAAYMSEIVRGGILAVEGGQREAAEALGMSYRRTMQLVILPQGLRRMVPATVSQLITLNKDTTLVSIIAIQEVMRHGRIVTGFNFFGGVPAPLLQVFIFIGLLFIVVNFALSRLSRRLEIRERSRTGGKLERVKGLEDQVAADPI